MQDLCGLYIRIGTQIYMILAPKGIRDPSPGLLCAFCPLVSMRNAHAQRPEPCQPRAVATLRRRVRCRAVRCARAATCSCATKDLLRAGRRVPSQARGPTRAHPTLQAAASEPHGTRVHHLKQQLAAALDALPGIRGLLPGGDVQVCQFWRKSHQCCWESSGAAFVATQRTAASAQAGVCG